ncbi:Stk1 family PASTA domain-containing Ser/Thr kinase [Schleiferilactobacillus harbinensis]|uniref:Stk1 family PASTA domain-containing Ser/Thr kinase n=1 Tax=Schleiferilactobacillus harbinensis TaxID=304207 RepID=UPI0011744634|nr:Stk1 family PASTA domain-containing Ser/Thr kinase [Schleiferilactobacillus harbinensis]GEK05916.1 protein kinase [Schleiferilactobacillus harbinensis]
MMENNYLLADRYRIKHLLGEGGMANVYLAHDEILDRDVAVKVLRLDLRNDQETQRRFQREAKATSELNHPNIVSILDVGEEEGMQYIVMEYVKGEDLKKYIVKHFPIPYQRVVDMMEQILSAVAHAHAHGIIHRDLKPQNILVDEQGNVKITDFGIAVILSDNSITQTNSLLGSVHYLSPEQARGHMATKQSDIYSLGIILYEMLTGSVPFEGESAVSIAIKHFQNEMPAVRDFDPRVPQALENVILKATAKDPSQRYATVVDMATDLKTSLSPKRAGEPKWAPDNSKDLEETKVLPAIAAAAELAKPTQAEAATDTPEPAEKAADTEPQPAKKTKKKKPWWLWAGLAAGAIVIIVVAALFLTAKKDVKVPNLAGLTQQQAETTLQNADLDIGTIEKEYSNTVDKGDVIRSIPARNQVIKQGNTVNLIVSRGKKGYKLGNYVGDSYDTVAAALRKEKIDVKREYANSADVAPGEIMRQSPKAGKTVIPGSDTVTLTVSRGKKQIVLRDLSNYTKKSVQDYADENGLNVTFRQAYSNTVSAGLVMSQDPAAGTDVTADTNVVVTLSQGTQPTKTTNFTKTVQIPYLAPAASSSSADSSDESSTTSSSSSSTSEPVPNDIVIYIQDKSHSLSTVYREFKITKDTPVELPFTVDSGQTAHYRITRDGTTIADEQASPNGN